MAFPNILIPEAAQVWHLNLQLAHYESLPPEHHRLIQSQSLRTLFAWAWTHSAFWKERLSKVGWIQGSDPWDVLGSLPSLTRTEVQDHFDALSCGKVLIPDSCIVARTTGSTGRPVETLKHKASYQLRYCAYALRGTVWHQLDTAQNILKYSVRVKDGRVENWGAPEAWFSKTGALIFCQSMGHDLSRMYDVLKTNRPGYVVADGAIAKALSGYALEHDPDRPQVQAILTTGSAITTSIREECKHAFGAKVINRYSNEEVGWMAIQCPKHDHLHVMSSNVIIEIVDEAGRPSPPGQPGRLLVTALHSEAMPLIRYEVGDIAEWGKKSCDCGIQLPVISRIWGREREFFRTPTGALRYIVILAEAFLVIAPVKDMRFRYYTNPLLRFEVVCPIPLTPEQRHSLTGYVRSLLGFECPVEIEERSAIDWGESDKRIAFMVMDQPWIG